MNPRVIVVENETNQASRLRGTLEKWGYCVSVVTADGLEAAAEAAKDLPAVVLVPSGTNNEGVATGAEDLAGAPLGIPVIFWTPSGIGTKPVQAAAEGLGERHPQRREGDIRAAIESALDGSLIKTRLGEAMKELHAEHGELRDQRGFFEALFNSIPTGVLVVDSRNRVRAVNPKSKEALGLKAAPPLEWFWCEVLGCPEATDGHCGKRGSLPCQYSGIESVIQETFDGRPARRQKAFIQSRSAGGEKHMDLLVSTSLSRIKGEDLCIVLLEDVTETAALREQAHQGASYAGIVGRDVRIQAIFHTIRDLADRTVPVLICGESGTGKELVAAAIHRESPRVRGPFIALNCGAIPEPLFESELFGHVKGAFTDALRDKKGRFELASGGTLFLDEVGELSPLAQVKLLRVLQGGTFEPVGSERTMKVDVRIVSATNKDLAQAMKEGRFRSDLYYRLCVVPIILPPLRERPGDIPLLAEHLLGLISQRPPEEAPKPTPEALRLLMTHSWPGNVRELENVLHYAYIQSRGEAITPEHLFLPAGLTDDRPLRELIWKPPLDRERVCQSLRETGGNKARAARLLGVSRSTLYRAIGQHCPDLAPLVEERERPEDTPGVLRGFNRARA
jgi:DNA-binding NtrC family response regulator